MAAIVSIAVGFAGAAIGTAVGAAIGGTILGISVATIGGVIGAGIAGGLLSMARGGEFGKGFLMGAGGAAIGAFASSLFEGAGGAADAAASGATEGTIDAAAGTGTALEGTAGAAGEIAGATGDIAAGAEGVTTYGLGEVAAPVGTPLDAAGGSGLEGIAGSASTDYSMPVGEQAALGTQSTGLSTLGAPPAATSSYDLSSGFGGDFGGASTSAGGGLENAAFGGSTGLEGAAAPSSYSFPTDSGASPLEGAGGTSGGNLGQTMVEGSGSQGGLSGMWDSAKTMWNNNMPSGSASKLALGGMDYLQKNYETDKLERLAKKQQPLSFEQFKSQYFSPNKYRTAANQMGRGGHTGTLPALLARMNQGAQAEYARYLPGAQNQNLNNMAAISNMRQGNRAAAIRPLSELMWGTK